MQVLVSQRKQNNSKSSGISRLPKLPLMLHLRRGSSTGHGCLVELFLVTTSKCIRRFCCFLSLSPRRSLCHMKQAATRWQANILTRRQANILNRPPLRSLSPPRPNFSSCCGRPTPRYPTGVCRLPADSRLRANSPVA